MSGGARLLVDPTGPDVDVWFQGELVLTISPPGDEKACELYVHLPDEVTLKRIGEKRVERLEGNVFEISRCDFGATKITYPQCDRCIYRVEMSRRGWWCYIFKTVQTECKYFTAVEE